nr:reverse transcriptase domain-containing protein [Tanacetum cinerariifolium]
MRDKDLNTILEKEMDEVIKSSVEDLVPIPSESKDTSESDSEYDLSSCDDFSPINISKGKSMTFSNPLFEFDDEYISSEVNPLFEEVLENIKNTDSYDSNLDEPDLLVTSFSDANEDECFDPGGVIDEIDAIDIRSDFKDGYYDSKGDVLYLESLLSDDTTANLPPEEFLDRDPRSLSDINDLKIMVKVFDPGIPKKFFSPTYKIVTPAPVKAVKESCVTCGGTHAYYNCPNTDNNQPSVCVTTGTYNQVAPQNHASNFMAPPGFAPVQNGQNRLSLPELTPTRMTLELADRSITRPKGVAKDVFIKTTRYSSTYDDLSVNRIDIIDVAKEEYAQEILGFSNNSSGGNPTLTFEHILLDSSLSLTPFEGSDFFLEEIDAYLKDESISLKIGHANCDPEGDICLIEKLLNDDPFQLPPMDLKQGEVIKAKSSIEEPSELELKELPSHLEYVYLEDVDKLPVIIAKDLKVDEKEALLKVFKSHKREIAWKITDIKGIDPTFCTHKILMEEDYKPAEQSQRQVNLKIHELIKKEVIKLLDAGMIYPISDSQWRFIFIVSFSSRYIATKVRRHQLSFKLGKVPFMVKKGIVLDHKISKNRLEFDCSKVDVIAKLPYLTIMKALKYLLSKQDAKSMLIRWVLLLQEFDIIIRDKKGTENLAANHLSRIENPHKDVFENKDINENFPLETLGKISSGSTPSFADFANFHAENFIVKDFMGPFPSSRGNMYILVAVDYLSKWVKVKALPANDARVVVKFLKSLFARFETPRAIIKDTKSAKEIWDHLARLYEARSLHNKKFLKRKLYALRMTESISSSMMLPPPFWKKKIGATTGKDRQTSSRHVEALVVTRGRSMKLDSSGSHNHGENTKQDHENYKRRTCTYERRNVAANLYHLKGEIMEEAEASVASHSPSHRVAVTWHQKLGHMSKQGMKFLVERKLLPGLTKVSLPFYEHCVISKQHRLKFKISNSRSVYVLELVHSDVWQAPVLSLGGAKYFVFSLMTILGDVGCTQSRRSLLCLKFLKFTKRGLNLILERRSSV